MIEEQMILKGCGTKPTYWDSSLCREGNLCSDCQEKVNLIQKAREETLKDVDKTIERLYLANEEAFSNKALIRFKDKIRKYLMNKYNTFPT